MKYLLDTHVWVWSQEALENLGDTARAQLKDTANEVRISPVSTLEIARLIQLGRITLKGTLRSWVTASMNNLLADTVEISHEIAIKAYRLKEPFHKDPADRLLVATALYGELTLMTADEKILSYPEVQTFNARN